MGDSVFVSASVVLIAAAKTSKSRLNGARGSEKSDNDIGGVEREIKVLKNPKTEINSRSAIALRTPLEKWKTSSKLRQGWKNRARSVYRHFEKCEKG